MVGIPYSQLDQVFEGASLQISTLKFWINLELLDYFQLIGMAGAGRLMAQALKMALCARQSDQGLVHHSDRGIQYFSSHYQAIHQRHGLRCSMTDGYDCYQNALAERVNGILKAELLLQRPVDLE